MELLYCTCGHREGMHSARDGACFEHGCPCTHFEAIMEKIEEHARAIAALVELRRKVGA